MHPNMTFKDIAKYDADFTHDPVNALRMNAVVKNGLSAAGASQPEDIAHPMIFSIEIETGKITHQKSSGRCWLFAGLNTLRFQVMKNLNLETFELSQNYQMFWDKFEKANYFLESILETLDQPTEGRLIHHLLAGPLQDGGQWEMFAALVEKYGVAPKAQMPETFHSSNTGMMVKFLTLKLREDAKTLRDKYTQGETDIAKLRALKDEYMSEMYSMLCVCLGQPPTVFDFEYRDKDKQFHRVASITPQRFFTEIVKFPIDDYVSIINAPTQDKPYNKTYTVGFLGNVRGGRPVKYLNLAIEEQKELAIRQLKDNEPVWFGCDVGQMLARDGGLMGMHTFDYEGVLGVKFGLNKAARLDYGESLMTHAMVFLGVNLVDDKPNRWKVENSWGDKSGQEGYYIMSDEWFDEYNYQIVVNKKYLSDQQKAVYEQQPIELKPWDPMGSLA